MEQRSAKNRRQVVLIDQEGGEPSESHLVVKENEKTDRCGRGRGYSSDNQREKTGSQQKKLCKEHFKVGQATPEKQGPGPGMHRNK